MECLLKISYEEEFLLMRKQLSNGGNEHELEGTPFYFKILKAAKKVILD